MTASAALGIAVDDTVHVLTWFRRGIARGLSRYDAIREAFAHCAGAMVHTSLICACGLMVFALSTFVPILHFAWLMFFLLMAALLGDLVLLPAILAGPLGVFFVQRKKSTSDVTEGQESSRSKASGQAAKIA
jgi:predicted RND superfamily exporter protein